LSFKPHPSNHLAALFRSTCKRAPIIYDYISLATEHFFIAPAPRIYRNGFSTQSALSKLSSWKMELLIGAFNQSLSRVCYVLHEEDRSAPFKNYYNESHSLQTYKELQGV
jgi:hypothetical protein